MAASSSADVDAHVADETAPKAARGRGRPSRNKEGVRKDDEAVEKKKVKKKQNVEYQYDRYIFKLLKQVHKKMRISKQAMGIMQSCLLDTKERIATEATRLCRIDAQAKNKDISQVQMSTRTMQSAVKLVVPGELSKHAVSEGCKVIMQFQKSTGKSTGKDGAGKVMRGRRTSAASSEGSADAEDDDEDEADEEGNESKNLE